MTKISIEPQAKQVRVVRDAELVSPVGQATTNSYADVSGSKIDTLGYQSVSYTIKNTDATDDLDWKVLGSNDDSTYVEVQAEATIQNNNGLGSYATTQAVYRYYKVQVKSTVADTPASATVVGIAK